MLRTGLPSALAVLLLPLAARAQTVTDLPRADRTLAPRTEEVFRIGGADGPEWQELARVTQAAFDAAGRLYVLDSQGQRVIVVGADGTHVRTHDLRGDGPGEFRSPVSLGVAPDGTLLVFDVGHMAFLRFGPDGRFQGQEAHGPERGLPLRGFKVDGQGRVLFSGDGLRIGADGGGGPTDRRPIRRLAPGAGSEVETAYDAWRLPPPERPVELSPGGGMRFSMGDADLAFAPGLHFGLLPGGMLAVADSVGYAVKLVGAGGRVERVLRRPLPPRRVGERDREAYRRQRMEAAQGGGGGGRPGAVMIVRGEGGGGGSGGSGSQTVTLDQKAIERMVAQQLEQTSFAEERPVIAGLATDWTGRIWVERTAEDVGADGPIDVLSPTGGYLGTVPADGLRLPLAFGPDDRMAVVELDALDVPTVVVLRLTGLR